VAGRCCVRTATAPLHFSPAHYGVWSTAPNSLELTRKRVADRKRGFESRRGHHTFGLDHARHRAADGPAAHELVVACVALVVGGEDEAPR